MEAVEAQFKVLALSLLVEVEENIKNFGQVILSQG
jgi:hypothetical protein